MKCALFCIKKLSEYYTYETDKVIEELNTHIGKQGLNLLTLIEVCNNYNVQLKAYQSLFMLKQMPCIILLKPKHKGHYIVILKVNTFTYSVYDETYGIRKIGKLRLYLFWTHISVLCYNGKRSEDHT